MCSTVTFAFIEVRPGECLHQKIICTHIITLHNAAVTLYSTAQWQSIHSRLITHMHGEDVHAMYSYRPYTDVQLGCQMTPFTSCRWMSKNAKTWNKARVVHPSLGHFLFHLKRIPSVNLTALLTAKRASPSHSVTSSFDSPRSRATIYASLRNDVELNASCWSKLSSGFPITKNKDK